MFLPISTKTGFSALNDTFSPTAKKLETGNHLSENKETFEIDCSLVFFLPAVV